MIDRTRPAIATLLLLVTAVAVGLAVAGHASTPRTLVMLAFYLFVPGAAIIGLVSFKDVSLEIASALGLSLGIDIVVAEAMLLAHAWEPFTAFYTMAALSAALLVFQIGRGLFTFEPMEA